MAPDSEAALSVTSTRTDVDHHRIAVTGDLDLATSSRLLDALMAALALPGARDVVLDFGGVNFLDASGVGVIVRARLACRHLGGRLTLFGARGIVAEVLHLTGVAESVGLPMRMPRRVAAAGERFRQQSWLS
jgi:anti-sigma B factor antagonist